ncbi:Ankyrin-like protein [Colletotrichum sojae]|uniref:Ankyrin-like protein n=1 Tax=Colletotrichum sojae TaxID=2175907 RepID=A0A8H6IT90_9PEZI|nr:Ankyrin-like protein [Colletotrichum sojae]
MKPTWTPALERKLVKLYLYTMLPVSAIVEIIQYISNNGFKPSKDLVQKKLGTFFDKEYRWLRPRTREDVERRLARLQDRGDFDAPAIWTNESTSDNGDKSDRASSRFNMGQAFSWPVIPSGVKAAISTETQELIEQHFPSKGYQLACLLNDTSVPVAKSCEETKFCNKHGAEASCLCEYDCSETSDTCSPRGILASDMLMVDRFRREQGVCLEGTDAHDSKNCICDTFNQPGAEAQFALWATPHGLTPLAHRISRFGPVFENDITFFDCFGNTILHFLAARAHPIILIRTIIEYEGLSAILNTSGQSFLHCLSPVWYEGNLDFLRFLLRYLKSTFKPDLNTKEALTFGPSGQAEYKFDMDAEDAGELDIYAKDVYGRSIFHLMSEIIPDKEVLRELFAPFESSSYKMRDAFGPFPGEKVSGLSKAKNNGVRFMEGEDMDASTVSSIEYQAQLQETIDKAYGNRYVEFRGGKNALHCVAEVVLSPDSLFKKVPNLNARPRQAAHNKRTQGPKPTTKSQDLDSSERYYKRREEIVKDLLGLKVDANAYDDDGNTVLMYFIAQLPEDNDRKTPVKIIKSVIDSGVDIQARNRSGETALHVAVRLGKKLAMKSLVEMGANVNVKDFQGQTPLRLLASCLQEAGSDMVTYAHLEACYSWLSGQAEVKSKSSVLDEWGWFGLPAARGSEKIRSAGREEWTEESPVIRCSLRDHKNRKTKVILPLRLALEKMDLEDVGEWGNNDADHEVKSKRLVKVSESPEPSKSIIKIEDDGDEFDVSAGQTPESLPSVDDICSLVLSSAFKVSPSELSQPEMAWDSVHRCLNELSVIASCVAENFDPPADSTDNSQDSSDEPNLNDLGDSPEGSKTTVSHSKSSLKRDGHSEGSNGKKRRRQDTPSGDGNQGDECRSETKARAQKKIKSLGRFSCPYRKRNPLRFNVRDHESCALVAFDSISLVK